MMRESQPPAGHQMQIKIHIKTSKGTQALLDGSIGLDDRHVRVLSLLDGSRGPIEIAPLAHLSESDAADILQKLILIGYARSTTTHYTPPTPNHEDAFGSESSQTFDPHASSQSDADPVDLAELRRAAKERSGATSSAGMDLGSASDVWQQTQLIAQQVMNERIERERKDREAAERELHLAQEREAAHKKARIAAEEALARERASNEERARQAAAAMAAKAAADELEAAKDRRMGVYKRRMRLMAAGACLAGIGAICFFVEATLSLNADQCGAMLSRWAQAKSSAKSCEARFFPLPHFEAKGISFGDIYVEKAEGEVGTLPLLIGRLEPSSLNLSGAKLTINSASSLLRLPSVKKMGHIREIGLDNVSLSVGNLAFQDLRGRVNLASDGHVEQITLNDEANSSKIALTIEKGDVKGSFHVRYAEGSAPPIPGLRDMSFDGSLRPDGISIEQGSATHASGYYSFKGDALWSAKRWSLRLAVESRSANLTDISPWLFTAGRASLNGSIKAEGATVLDALNSAVADVDASFNDMSLKLDLAESLGAGSGTGNSAFALASGKASIAKSFQNFSFPALANGPMKATVKVGLAPDGRISGGATATLTERGISAESLISGTMTRMQLSAKNSK